MLNSTHLNEMGVISRVKRLKSITTSKLEVIESSYINLNQRIRDEIENIKTELNREEETVNQLDFVIITESEKHKALILGIRHELRFSFTVV